MKILTVKVDTAISGRLADLSLRHGITISELTRLGLRTAYGIEHPGTAALAATVRPPLPNGVANPPQFGAAVPND